MPLYARWGRRREKKKNFVPGKLAAERNGKGKTPYKGTKMAKKS